MHYDYECTGHGAFDCLVPISERHYQPCPVCGFGCAMVFTPTRARAVVFGSDRIGDNPNAKFGSKRHKREHLKASGLIELEDSRPDQYARDDARTQKELKAKRVAKLETKYREKIQDLGESLYTKHPDKLKSQEHAPDVLNRWDHEGTAAAPIVDGV